jgi:ATP-binding cassette subfamily B protein
LDARLRLATLLKIPRLGDRYLQSRLTSDMAERSHSIHLLRSLPWIGVGLLTAAGTLILTALGIAWLDPASAPLAVLSAALAVGLPFAAQPLLVERELRQRTHSGALGRFTLDALLGLVPVRSHGAEPAMRREHESLLVEWVRAGLGVQRGVVAVQAVQMLAGYGLAAWLLARHLASAGGAGAALLLAYWALSLPELGQSLALLARQYPTQRNVALRLLEPLAAPEEPEARAGKGPHSALQAEGPPPRRR